MDIVEKDDDKSKHIRANLFFRMRDLTHRSNNDSRLLVATMHTEVFPTSCLRGKCRVKHRDLIGNGTPPDLATWKRRDDHFYFYQLFDRYIHRFFDVVPTWKIKNAPEEVLETLRERYSFIVAELSVSADLCDALRGCAICRQWASSSESVRCDTCRKFFHMHCLSPPLLSKPAKGYSWTCAPCAKKHDDIVDEQGVGGGGLDSDLSTAVRGPRSKNSSTRRTNKAHLFGDVLEPEHEKVLLTAMDREGLRCYQGWPYRYFGEHSNAMDVLDSHDSIYPRAVTRIGPKYQVTVPSWEESSLSMDTTQADIPMDGASSSKEAKRITPRLKRRGITSKRKREDEKQSTAVEDEDMALDTDKTERGDDGNVDVICIPPPDQDWEKVDQYLANVQAPHLHIPRYAYPFYNRALSLLCAMNFDYHKAAEAFARTRDSDVKYFPLTPKEVQILEKTIMEQSGDLSSLKPALPNRTPSEIIQGVYEWKLKRLGERWRGKENTKVTLRGPRIRKSDQKTELSPSRSVLSLKELAVMQEQKPSVKLVCSFCSTNTSPFWYRGFINWTGRVLCVYCGQYWRKYAAETASAYITDVKRQAALDRGSEEAGLGLIVPKVGASSADLPALPPSDLPSLAPVTAEGGKCVVCRRMEPRKLLKSCVECGMAGHQGCIGIDENAMEKNAWLCDLCMNDKELNASILPFCVLCGETPTDRVTSVSRRRKNGTQEVDPKTFTALDVYKPTECNNWAHLLCSTWIPEILYANSSAMQPVEGAGSLPVARLEARCSLCDEVKGACVSCAEPTCRTQFHVSCAYLAQPHCALGFEIFPVKTSRRDSVHTLKFKSESGHMVAQIWCKEHLHVAKTKKTYDLFEMDSKLKLTALQAYALTHKQVPSTSHRNMALIESTHALLRRAKKLDAIIQVCGGAGGYVENGHLIPMKGKESEMPMEQDDKDALVPTEDKPVTCIQCHTDWSPIWWPLPSTKDVCCNICRSTLCQTDIAIE
ncbi:putative PHD type zinc finger protein with BAH domain-containing protein [Malassezia pachydermatis]